MKIGLWRRGREGTRSYKSRMKLAEHFFSGNRSDGDKIKSPVFGKIEISEQVGRRNLSQLDLTLYRNKVGQNEESHRQAILQGVRQSEGGRPLGYQ